MNSTSVSENGGPLAARPALIGLARLMTMAFQGLDLLPLAESLIERAADPRDADALMDLSTILQLQGLKELGLATQAQALQVKRLFTLPASRGPALRLLAIMAPGDLMTNAPLPFLLEDSDVSLSMLYLRAGEALPLDLLPDFDLAYIAVSESDATRSLLDSLAERVAAWPMPVVNPPARIIRTSRAHACSELMGTPGLSMPATARVSRADLHALAQGRIELDELLADGLFPLIVRPVDSHAGNDLERLDAPTQLVPYLEATAGDALFISRFIDYSSPDGLFRKYRVVLIDGQAYAGHMGVSVHWMIHYLNAGMTQSTAKRAEEEFFMSRFELDFGRRHAPALRAIAERMGLQYLVVDCGETADGDLLIFEVDPGAVVHSMDPVDLFPYKPAHMNKVYAAFRAMLGRVAGGTR